MILHKIFFLLFFKTIQISADFTFLNKIFNEISKTQDDVFFSPLSIHTVLSMIFQGASGETEAEIQNVLKMDKKTAEIGYSDLLKRLNYTEGIILNLANKMYVGEKFSLKESFKQIIANSFYSEVESINFYEKLEAAKIINEWAENVTNNAIRDLINPDDLSESVGLVLVNAVYFNGHWLKPFNTNETKKDNFYRSDNDTVEVEMMNVKDTFLMGEIEELDAQVIELKYKNCNFSMVILLPNENDGIENLISKLSNFNFFQLTEGLEEQVVEVSIPKFQTETTIDITEHLKNMDVESMFSDFADFTEMVEASSNKLSVGKIIQKAFIEINEEGSEAAAASIHEFLDMRDDFYDTFNANHPFIYIIEDSTSGVSTPFFIGILRNL